MTDPRASSVLRHLPLGDPPPSRWNWAVVTPDPAGRVRLPPSAAALLRPGPVRARVSGGVLVLDVGDGPGHPVTVDSRGRAYLPAWLRVPAVLVATHPEDAAVLLVDATVLDPIGNQLLHRVRS